MDLALGRIDFIEVLQFGVLKSEQWYELLNAGFQVTGVAGSDFAVPLHDMKKPLPRSIPLLGPERTMVKARATGSPYEAWAAGVRRGDVVLSNGPLLEMQVNRKTGAVTARASFYQPLEPIEIVRNGVVIAAGEGTVSATVDESESCRVAARVDPGAYQSGLPVARREASVRARGSRSCGERVGEAVGLVQVGDDGVSGGCAAAGVLQSRGSDIGGAARAAIGLRYCVPATASSICRRSC